MRFPYLSVAAPVHVWHASNAFSRSPQSTPSRLPLLRHPYPPNNAEGMPDVDARAVFGVLFQEFEIARADRKALPVDWSRTEPPKFPAGHGRLRRLQPATTPAWSTSNVLSGAENDRGSCSAECAGTAAAVPCLGVLSTCRRVSSLYPAQCRARIDRHALRT